MSRSWTVGGNLAGTVTAIDTGPFTMGCWAFSTGAAVNGRFMELDSGGGTHILFLGSAASAIWTLSVSTSGTAMQRSSAANFPGSNIWTCCVAVYNDSLTASANTLYQGTLATPMAVTGTTGTNGTGTRSTGITNVRIGNRLGADRPWEGRLAQAFYLPWAMTRDEAERFRLGDWTVLLAHGAPRFFQPMTSAGLFDVGGSTGLWTATTVTAAEDPPIAAGWG